MAATNPLWGAPRIHGELLKLGIDVAERTVSRLLPRPRRSPSQTWRTFLANHVRDLVSLDFFTVPTARLRVLCLPVVLVHHRRRVVHFNVTEHPTAHWTAQQIVDAFPDDSAPAYLLRDRDSVYGHVFRQRVKGIGIGEVLTAPHCPWQNPFAERLIGSITPSGVATRRSLILGAVVSALALGLCAWLIVTDAPAYRFVVRVYEDKQLMHAMLDRWGVLAPVVFIAIQS